MTHPLLAISPGRPDVDQLDEPFLYHDLTRPGFTSLVTPGGTVRQASFKLSELVDRVSAARAQSIDGYIAQNEFFRPNRRVVNCWRLTSFYVDLDTYKVPELQGRPPELLAQQLLMACDDQGIPQPTVVVFSGRGLQAKWILESPVLSSALPRWQAVQEELCRRLGPHGADPRALDASRVLRLVGTVNCKSGDTVRVVYWARTPTLGASLRNDGVVVYEFETFAENVLPVSRTELQRQRAEREALEQAEIARREADARRRQAVRDNLTLIQGDTTSGSGSANPGARRLVPSVLAWDRLDDLRRLAKLRGWHDGAPSGQRNLFVFLGACFLATARVAPAFRAEVRELAREFAPTWSHTEVQACTAAVLARVEAAARGEKIVFRGVEVDPRYCYSNTRLVELLEIAPSEMAEMRTIIDKTEARRRDAARKKAKRRELGCLSRDEYCARAEHRAQSAREMRAAGATLAEIARTLAISRASASQYCRQVNNKS
jgi:hypothetical protein